MEIYHFKPDNGEFLGTGIADLSPLETEIFLIPAYSTPLAPPVIGDQQVAVFNGSGWDVLADHRGQVYFLADGSQHQITQLGVVPPVDALTSAPVTQDQLLAAVDAERHIRWRAGFPVQIAGVVKWFHSDIFSLAQHLGLKDKARDILAAGGLMTDNITIAGQPVHWSTMDGSQVAITVQVAFDLVAGAALQQALVFLASQAHEVAINAAEDLSDYDVLAGWPAVFGE
ncbi:MAG: hypothetical protein KGZ88_08970 [Methylomicrobium sp.]|nr:hypothetical protein [Methylomicrobium sp.]